MTTMRTLIYIAVLLFSVQTYGQTLPTRHHNSFNDFYERIADNKYLKFTNLPLTDTLTQIKKKISNDSIEETF